MKVFTLDEYAMGRDKRFPKEWELARPNATDLIQTMNAFFDELEKEFGIERPEEICSGFRPETINKQISNAAPNSGHKNGTAVDFKDSLGEFKKKFQPLRNVAHAALMRKHNIMMEHPDFTPTWVHFDKIKRMDRPSRTFRPR